MRLFRVVRIALGVAVVLLLQACKTELPVPGLIEAEQYHEFLDTTPGNTGGAFRQQDVDIEPATGDGGGYNVGWIAPGEYLRYRIRVTEAGNYRLRFRVATELAGRHLSVKLNGATLLATVNLPNTGGWQTWADVVQNAALPAGSHVLELSFPVGEFNLNYVDIQRDTGQPPVDGWQLVWSDEFNGSTIDMTKWEHEVNAWGGGNNELQYYTARSQNSFIRDGKLVIQALRENYTGPEGTRQYTSARLRTRGKGDWLYGRIEVRAKLPYGQGLWPAIWMLPTDNRYGGWAASGEIDIMEAVNLRGAGGNDIHGTTHFGGVWPNNTHAGSRFTPAASVVDHFHDYAIEWEPAAIRWYVNGQLYRTQTSWWSAAAPFPAPFDERFHLLLNVAVGGNWPGNPDGSSVFPQTMEVDYVRVYQRTAP